MKKQIKTPKITFESLSKSQQGKVRNLMLISNMTEANAIKLVIRRAARLGNRAEFIGNAKKAKGYYIL